MAFFYIIPNEFQDEGFIKMNNFCLRRDEKAKDSRVTLLAFLAMDKAKRSVFIIHFDVILV